jgi:hypothetical protein
VNGRQHYQDFLSLQDSTHRHFRTWFRFTRQRLGFLLSFVIAGYDNIATDESAPVREGQKNGPWLCKKESSGKRLP